MEQIIDMLTVLTAENDNHQTTSVNSVLKKHFHDCCTLQEVHTSISFYRYLETHSADMIIIDLDMPGINFHTLHRYLQLRAPGCYLLVTADTDSFDPLALPPGFQPDNYLLRPCSEEETILALEDCFFYCKQKAFEENAITMDLPEQTDEFSRLQIIRGKIQQYIQEHYADILSMQDVAHAMNYSDTHFCRLFKQCFHVNFSVYLNEFRIEQACKMLLSGNKTVKEVSISCGYRDTSYFIRVFKRFTGTTPSNYRFCEQPMTAKKYNKS